ncbi:hypothetical protein [Nocardia sp. NPDC004123]
MTSATVRIKSVVSNPVEKSDGSARPFIGLENMAVGTGRLLVENLPMKAAEDSIRHRAGDVLFSKLRPYLAKSHAPTAEGTGTGELLVLRPTAQIDAQFLLYVTLSAPWLDWANATAYGTKMPRTSWDLMCEYRTWLPSLEEQRRIADFLDAETSRIDRLMKARERQIVLLKDRRWSQFQELVDRSGSPMLQIRRVVESLTDGPFGSAFSSSDYSDEGAAVVRLGNIGFAEYRPADQARVPMSVFDRFRQYSVQSGDVLIAGLGDAKNHAGRACVAPDLGAAIVKGKCFRMRLNAQGDPEFIATLLSSPIGASAVEGRGSTRSMINLDVVKSARVPIPPMPVQRRIVADHADAWSQMERLVNRGAAQISLLAERRQALITAAVTGQFDVTTASGRNLTQGV